MFYVYFVLDFEMDVKYEENDQLKELLNAKWMSYKEEHRRKRRDYKRQWVIAKNLFKDDRNR